jgi:alginate O-acetyltransferase complex protein AlgJ
METTPSPRLWANRVLIVLFTVFLVLPLLDMVFKIDPTSPRNENRLLAPFPEAPKDIRGFKKFFPALEAYFNDHFGCRRVLIMWHNKLVLSLFKDDSHEVLVGTDGWLYFTSSRMIDHYRGDLQFTEKDLCDWQNLLEHRRDWLADRGIKYIFVIAPDKQSIYPEYLPAWLTKTGRPTKVDEFLAYMKAHSTVEILDLRPVLLTAKKSAPVFQKTDTHWNQSGAFAACESIVSRLAEDQLPELTPMSPEAFNITNRLTEDGDLARMLGVSMIESNAFFFTPKPGLPALEISDPTMHPEGTRAFSKQPGGRGLAFVYHDSFGHYWIPFLGYEFQEVDYFWQTYFDPKMIDQKRPEVVIDEEVERFFNTADPGKLAAADALPGKGD